VCHSYELNILLHFTYHMLHAYFQIVEEKKRFKKNPHNYAIKKTDLLKLRVSSNIMCDSQHEKMTTPPLIGLLFGDTGIVCCVF